jgi:hypothetical protein
LVEELKDEAKTLMLVRSPFGKYVIKKGLSIADEDTKFALINVISNTVNSFNEQKLSKKWQKILNLYLTK